MGWASGSRLAEEIWNNFRRYIPEEKLKLEAEKFVALFEDMDCDTLDECEQLMSDLKKRKVEKKR